MGESDSEPISESVSNGSHGSPPFSGRMERVAAIEAPRSPVAGAGGVGGADAETLGSVPGAKAPGL
jgi:hypothetical protein